MAPAGMRRESDGLGGPVLFLLVDYAGMATNFVARIVVESDRLAGPTAASANDHARAACTVPSPAERAGNER